MPGMFDDLIPQSPAPQGPFGMFADLVPSNVDPAALPNPKKDWVSARDRGLPNKVHNDGETGLQRDQRIERNKVKADDYKVKADDYADNRSLLTKVIAPFNTGAVRLVGQSVSAAGDILGGVGDTIESALRPDDRGLVDRLNDIHDIWTKAQDADDNTLANAIRRSSDKTADYFAAGEKAAPEAVLVDPVTRETKLNPDVFKDPWTYWNIFAENAPQIALQLWAGTSAYVSALRGGASVDQAAVAAARVGRYVEGAQIFADEFANAREKGLGLGKAGVTALGVTLPSIAISQGIQGTASDGGMEAVFFKKMAESAEKAKGLKGIAARTLFGIGKEAAEEMGQEVASVLGQSTYDPDAIKSLGPRLVMAGMGGGLLGGFEGAVAGPVMSNATGSNATAQDEANRSANMVDAVGKGIVDPNNRQMIANAMRAAGMAGSVEDGIRLLKVVHGIKTGVNGSGVGMTPQQIIDGSTLYRNVEAAIANNTPLDPNWQVQLPATGQNAQAAAGATIPATNGAQAWGEAAAGAHFDALTSTITGLEQQLAREKAVAAIDKNPSNPANKSRIEQLETLLAQAHGKRQTLSVTNAQTQALAAQPPLMTAPVTANPNTPQPTVLDRMLGLRDAAHARAVELTQQEVPVQETAPGEAVTPAESSVAADSPVPEADAPAVASPLGDAVLAAPAPQMEVEPEEPSAAAPTAPKQTLKERKRAKKAQAVAPTAGQVTVKTDGREISLPAETVEKVNAEAEAEHAAASASGKPKEERAADHKKAGERRKAKLLEAEKNQALDQDENLDGQPLGENIGDVDVKLDKNGVAYRVNVQTGKWEVIPKEDLPVWRDRIEALKSGPRPASTTEEEVASLKREIARTEADHKRAMREMEKRGKSTPASVESLRQFTDGKIQLLNDRISALLEAKGNEPENESQRLSPASEPKAEVQAPEAPASQEATQPQEPAKKETLKERRKRKSKAASETDRLAEVAEDHDAGGSHERDANDPREVQREASKRLLPRADAEGRSDDSAGRAGSSWAYQRTVPPADGGLRVLGVPVLESWHLDPETIPIKQGAKGIQTPDVHELDYNHPDAARTFREAIAQTKVSNPNAAAVEVKTLEDYNHCRLFLTEDGKAGFALLPDGDIVSVFRHGDGPRGVSNTLLEIAKQAGGRKLDCFDPALPRLYSEHGFKAVARIPFNDNYAPVGWDYDLQGRPDVVFMVHDKSAEVYRAGDGQMVADYSEGQSLQEAAIKQAEPLENDKHFAATKAAWKDLKEELADPKKKAARERGAVNPQDRAESQITRKIYALVSAAIHDGVNTFNGFLERLAHHAGDNYDAVIRAAGGKKGMRSIWDQVFSVGAEPKEKRLIYSRRKVSSDFMPDDPVDRSRLSDPAYRTGVAHRFADAALKFLQHHREEMERLGLPTGREWYTRRMQMFRERMIERGHEDLKDDLKWKAFWVLNAIASNGNTPFIELKLSDSQWNKFRASGYKQVVSRDGFGRGFMMRGDALDSAYRGVNKLLNEGGLERLVGFFEEKQSGRDIKKYFPSSTVPLGATIEGSYGLGPKIGAFFQNGIGHTSHLTKDLWFTRTWNRLLGLQPVFEKGEDGTVDKTSDAPSGPSERAAMDMAIDLLCKKTGLSPAEVQAELWYAEQNLWSRPEYMQENMNSGDFYDAVTKLSAEDHDQLEQIDASAAGDHPHVGLATIPSGRSGVLPGALDATFAQQRAFHTAAAQAADLDEAIKAVGLEGEVQLKTHFGVGSFAEEVGGKLKAETNPLTTLELATNQSLTQEIRGKLTDLCRVLSIIYRQAGVAWSMPDYNGKTTEDNAIKFNINRTLSEGETKRIAKALAEKYGSDDVWLKANPDGFSVVAGGWTDYKGPEFHKAVEKIANAYLPGDQIETGYYRNTGEYARNDFSKENPYANNLKEIAASRRSGLLRRYILQADERVQAVRERWSLPQGSRPGWGDPGRALTESDLIVPDGGNDRLKGRSTGELADMVKRGELTEAEFADEFTRRGGEFLQGGLLGNEAMWLPTKQLLTNLFLRAGEALNLHKDGTAEEIMGGLMADRFASKQRMLRLRTNLPCRDAADVALAFYGANTFLGANTDKDGLPVVPPTLVDSDTGEIHDDMNWLQKAYMKVGSPSAVIERGMLGRLMDAGYGPSSDWVKEQSRGFAIQQAFGGYFRDLYRDIANNRKALKKLFSPLGESMAKLEIQYFNVTSGLQKAQDQLWQGGLLPSERAFMEHQVSDAEAKIAALDGQLKALGNVPDKAKADPIRDQLRDARIDLETAQDELHRADVAERKGRTLSREEKARYRRDIEQRKAELADLDKQMSSLQAERENLVRKAFESYQDARVYMAAEYGANVKLMPEWMQTYFATKQGKAELAVAEKTTVMMNRMRQELEKAGIGVLDADSAYMHRPFGRLLSNSTLRSLQKQGYWEHQGKTLSARNVDSILDPEQVKFVSRERGSKIWFPSLYDSVEGYLGIFSRKLTGRTFANKWLYWADSNGYKFPGLAEGVRDMVKQVVAPDPSQQFKFLNDFTRFFYWKHIALSTWTAAKHAAKLAYDPIQIGPVASARGTAHLMHAKIGQLINWSERTFDHVNFGDSVLAKRARIKALVLQGHVGAKSIDQMVELGTGMSPIQLTSNATRTIAQFSARWPVSMVESYDRGVTLFSSIYGYAGKKSTPDVVRNVISNTLAINFMPFDRGTATQSSVAKAILAFQQAPIHLSEYAIQNATDLGRTLNDIAHGRKVKDVEAGWRSVRYFIALGLISQVIDKALDANLMDWFLHEPALIKWLMQVFTKGGAKEEDGPFQSVFASATETAGYVDKYGVGSEALLQATLPDQVMRWYEDTDTRKDRKAFGEAGTVERGIRTLAGAKRASEVEKTEEDQEHEREGKQRGSSRKWRRGHPTLARLADSVTGGR